MNNHEILSVLTPEIEKSKSPKKPTYKFVQEQAPKGEIRGATLWKALYSYFSKLDTWIERFIPNSLNPFVQSGAIANLTFVIALVSGFIVLIWYKPSVHLAYDSLQNSNFLGTFFRALHRYSSDACMFFILFHSFKMFFAQRFSGSRWLAWVTGIIAVGMLWFDGWLGYWLVWDERANLVAVGTAKMLDLVPIFAEPLSRSFLTDDSFNSLLFFIIFFFHMLIPLAIGIALWLHVSRLNKSHFFTDKYMSAWVTISLIAMSLFFPADLTDKAEMLKVQSSMPLDYWYLLPLYFTDRLDGGVLWLLSLFFTIGFIGIPWFLVKKQPQKPVVNIDKCNGCQQCFIDCPYNAITMIDRDADDHKRGGKYAYIDPDICLACGICVGSCDPAGIDYPLLQVRQTRDEIDYWLEEYLENNDQAIVAYVCSNSAAEFISVDTETGESPELPGYIIRSVPCSGWVHPLMVERAFKKGASAVVICGCNSEPQYRLGSKWTEFRLFGQRHPALRTEKVDDKYVYHVKYDTENKAELIQFLSRLQSGVKQKAPKKTPQKIKTYAVISLIILALGFIVYGLSIAPYSVPMSASEMVVTISIAGKPIVTNDVESQENIQPHMRGVEKRKKVSRTPVRLWVAINGETVYDKDIKPNGIFNDGMSTGIAYIPVPEGNQEVQIKVGDRPSGDWYYQIDERFKFNKNEKRVFVIDRANGVISYPK